MSRTQGALNWSTRRRMNEADTLVSGMVGKLVEKGLTPEQEGEVFHYVRGSHAGSG
jgi:hypothetical protein